MTTIRMVQLPLLDDPNNEVEVDDERRRTPVGSPGEALDAHLRLHRWIGSEYGRNHIEVMHRREAVRYGESDLPTRVMGQRALLMSAVDAGQTYYVSPDMVALTEALADEWGDVVPPLYFTDVPSEAGVMFLGKTVYFGDDPVLADFCRVRGFAWRLQPPGPVEVRLDNMVISLHATEPDVPMQRLQQHGGLMLWDLMDAGTYLTAEGALEANGRPPVLPMLITAYPFGDDVEPWVDGNTGPPLRRFLGVLFRLLWQRILGQEDWKPKRATARRMQHEWKFKDSDLYERFKVTHLRRYEPGWETVPEERGERGPMTHTVIVKGHPRDQWFPSLGPARNEDGTWNHETHRRIWIAPHYRGEGPLIEKHSITAVVR
jgi:hypothetical protein